MMELMKVPQWIKTARKDDEDDEVSVPPVAMIPRPPETDEEKRLATIATAHVYVEQLRQERAADRAEIERLQLELGYSLKELHAEKCKSGMLELELTKEMNDKQTLHTDLLEKDRCLSLLRQVLDKFGTKAPPKPERKPRPKKKADRESTDPAAEPIGILDEPMNNDTGIALAVLLVAAIGIVMLIFVVTVPAHALECQPRPDGKSYWSYRIIDGERCWYRGHRVIPKSRLHWPDEPKPKKMKGDPVFNQIRAEAGLDAVIWHMARPFDQAQPIIPPLNLATPDDPDACCWPDLSEFERRFVGVR